MDLFTLSASLGMDITDFEGGINTARRLLLQFAGAVVDFGQDVVETGMGFDKQMSAVQAVMGLTENTAENLATMNKLREFALEQARDSIFTSEEAATAYYYMGMAGWRAEQMVAGLPGIMALAAASGEDLKMTSDMVTDSLTAFGLGAGQAVHFADVLAVTATNANTDVARMQYTFKNLAPIAGALGYSIEDVALSVGLIANSGVKGSQAGTALRNIFTRLATNAGATAKDLGALQIVTDKLGVSFYTAEGRARPWGEVLMEMRTAWNKLDPDEVDKVTAAFGEFSAESQGADEIMAEFTNDLDEWTTVWNGLTTAVDRENFVAQLESQFAVLGVSMRDSNGQLREFSEVAKDARVKLGGLTDQEQIYYGKQIGSLRGISGLLALMTASEADVRQLTDAIRNADGAAQAMADTRLDNLWGDVTHFISVLDTLKIAIYDDVKGPMRDVVQWASGALEEITDAVNENGLAGGIDKLSEKIRELADDEHFRNLLGSVGKLVVPVLDEVINDLVPSIGEAAPKIASVLLKSMGDAMANGGDGVGGILGILTWFVGEGLDLTGGIVGFFRVAGEQSGKAIAEEIGKTFDPEVESGLKPDVINWLATGGDPYMIPDSILTATEEKAPDISSELYDATQEAAEFGSADFQDMFDSTSNAIADDLVSDIGNAGTDAGNAFGDNMQAALNNRNYTINVTASVSGLPVNRNASAMSGGRIYRTPSIFGYANGAFQIAGDAGPEAVVGVGSLQSMIENAVRGAVAVMAPGQGAATRPATIIIQLNDTEVGRTFLPAIEAERQRIGVQLARG